MSMVYLEDTLYVVLEGDVNINMVKKRVFNVLSKYNINNVTFLVGDVFNYKKRDYDTLLNDYSRVFKCNMKIEKRSMSF